MTPQFHRFLKGVMLFWGEMLRVAGRKDGQRSCRWLSSWLAGFLSIIVRRSRVNVRSRRPFGFNALWVRFLTFLRGGSHAARHRLLWLNFPLSGPGHPAPNSSIPTVPFVATNSPGLPVCCETRISPRVCMAGAKTGCGKTHGGRKIGHKTGPQGLKPSFILLILLARRKPCRCYKARMEEFFRSL